MAETAASINVTSALGLGHWTAEQVRSMANLSNYAPSTKDLLLVGPRLGIRLGSFLLGLPLTLDDALGSGVFRPRYIPDATESGGGAPTMTGSAVILEHVVNDIPVDSIESEHGLTSRLSLEGGRSFGNIFSYSTSRWALACLVMAILLNRTQVYAATRRSLVLGWKLRFVLRLLPILLFTVQIRTLLQSIHCQTSPDFGLMRWGNASKTSDFMFAQHDRTLHTISSVLLFGPPQESSCLAVQMIPDPELEDDVPNIRGSLSRLWPLFQTFCFSQFVEILSCTLQGRVAASETGMTIFEHSLGFAEAEATVSSSLGWGPFGDKKPPLAELAERKGIPEHHINRSMILNRVNVPPEVLLVGFLSSMNHLTSHILAIFNLQGRLRLLNTAFWGICFMSFIILSMFTFRLDNLADQALLRFPTVCIIGFVPHVMVLGGIIICGTIYTLAIALTALATPTRSRETDGLLSRIISAHENMQASITFSNIHINMHMDFYQALLKTGYNALTMASEAVYLNESSDIVVKPRTWLEEERLSELERAQPAWLGPTFWDSSLANVDDIGLVPAQDTELNSGRPRNGYARERLPLKPSKLKSEKPLRDGVGATERSGRWIMVFEYFVNITKLITSWTAALILKALGRVGSNRRPSWLVALTRKTKGPARDRPATEESTSETVQFWILDDDGRLTLPPNDVVDVEQEMKRRLQVGRNKWESEDEQNLGSQLYDWWLKGGWWGTEDNSGQYAPSNHNDDEDTTSIVSTTSDGSSHDWDDYDESDGRCTPTQENPSIGYADEAPPDTTLNMTDLATLLHPKTAEQRVEAQTLAAHLASDSIITRSKFREMRQRERLQVLLPSRKLTKETRMSAGRLSSEQEAEMLESLILARRAANPALRVDASTSSWAQGASGLGDGGPQCVVCQSAPRSIIVWPCRCLSLCDDCRVSLAMNNFDKCVCCRRDVGSFSRIFVP